MPISFVYLEFSQKAVAYNHVHCDHLNLALACLYCSFENNPKKQWYSASAWKHHSLKHHKENVPIHPDDPDFSQQFACVPGDDVVPFTSEPKQNLPHEEVIRKWAEADKQCFKEEQDLEGNQTSLPHFTTEGLKLSSLETPILKHHVKQGPVKSSKKLKV